MKETSVSVKQSIKQRDIFRLAATMYAHTSDVYSTIETQLQMIICLFADTENQEKTYSEIIVSLLSVYYYHISEEELISIIKRNQDKFRIAKSNGQEVVCLKEGTYSHTIELQEKNIDSYISEYIDTYKISDGPSCRDAIYKYLYELTTTNINSYRVLLFGNKDCCFTDSELSVNLDELTDWEIQTIHDFLEWEYPEKNVALGNIVYCCLEYCLLVNGDSPNSLLLNDIKKCTVYLDTNVIFRALGINGPSREKVVSTFLEKCKQANVSLAILANTKEEFEATIKRNIEEIARYPRGDIFLEAYESISDYTFFSFYNAWRQTHKGVSLSYFSAYIRAAYRKLIEKYDILDGEKIPNKLYLSDDFKQIRNSYSSQIQAAKQESRKYYVDDYDGHTRNSDHDATLISYIEQLRDIGTENDIFVVSSDKVLRYWDMSRGDNQYPIVVYPSQLFLILIKLYGRSQSDFDSFVSFINIRKKSQQLSPREANIVLSGISSITEDIQAQKILVSTVFGDSFQDILTHSNTDMELYQNVQEYSKSYLDLKIEAKDKEIQAISEESKKKDSQLKALEKDRNEKNSAIQTKDKEIAEKDSIIETVKQNSLDMERRVRSFAGKKVLIKYHFIWTILPVLLLLLWILYVGFVLLQFCWSNESWNIPINLLSLIQNTWFGKNVSGYPAVIDSALFIVLSALSGLACKKKPWNRENRINAKNIYICNYIRRNELL